MSAQQKQLWNVTKAEFEKFKTDLSHKLEDESEKTVRTLSSVSFCHVFRTQWNRQCVFGGGFLDQLSKDKSLMVQS